MKTILLLIAAAFVLAAPAAYAQPADSGDDGGDSDAMIPDATVGMGGADMNSEENEDGMAGSSCMRGGDCAQGFDCVNNVCTYTAKEPHKESLIGCSGGAQTWLWQVRESWTNRQHETAELTMYFVGGDGTLTLNGRNIQVAAGMLAVVPRGTEYGLTRNPKGRAAALYVVATLSGPPCAK